MTHPTDTQLHRALVAMLPEVIDGITSENMQESADAGRLPFQKNPGAVASAKLNEDDARYIRVSDGTQEQLAKLFKVTAKTIYNVQSRKTWKHI